MQNLVEFITNDLYPLMWERLDYIFPDMKFTKARDGWRSPFKLDGTPASSGKHLHDKTVCTKRLPQSVLEQGGEAMGLLNFYFYKNNIRQGLKGREFIEAIRPLAQICGVIIPELNNEDWQKYQERQDKLEKVCSKMKEALFTPEGAEVLNYLTKTRKYTEDEIKDMELGYCSTEAIKEMKDIDRYDYNSKQWEKGIGVKGLGEVYKLAIPYRSSGRILGFKFRYIQPVEGYDKYRNSRGLPKKASLFGLTGLLLTGDKKRDKDIAIVEGELDALHAQAKGVENIVSCTGYSDISEEALLEAKKRGVERVTIVVDYEETKEKRDEKEKAIKKAAGIIQSTGLKAFIAELPGEEGVKTDIDSYLLTHTSEELEAILDEAISGAIYLYNFILNRAVDKEKSKGNIAQKDWEDVKDEVIELLNDTKLTTPVDRDFLLQLFSNVNPALGITKETLQEEADKKKARLDIQRQEKKTRELLDEARNLYQEGDTSGALELLSSQVSKIQSISKEAEYAKLLALPTSQSISEKLKARPNGIELDYIFTSGQKKEVLVLPTGAITLVCALPSHGKSTLLRNLALQTAKKEDGAVLYFTFEEDYESTFTELVNTYVGVELTNGSKSFNNLTTIREYYRSGSTQYMKRESINTFKTKEAEFTQNYIYNGKLRIFDKDYYSDELIEIISYISQRIKVTAVFIDYIQLIYKQGSKLIRKEELREIAKSLRQLAKKLQIPIVLAGQLNRDAKSPTEMFNQNLADSADLEREANKIILLWNSNFKPLNGNQYKEQELEVSKRLNFKEESRIYALISKNRGGIPGIDAKLEYNGNTGVISTNYTPDEEQEYITL